MCSDRGETEGHEWGSAESLVPYIVTILIIRADTTRRTKSESPIYPLSSGALSSLRAGPIPPGRAKAPPLSPRPAAAVTRFVNVDLLRPVTAKLGSDTRSARGAADSSEQRNPKRSVAP